MMRLSGRFRSALIIGLQGIRSRKLRTLLSMVSLFLGVLAVVVVQAGASIAERALLADEPTGALDTETGTAVIDALLAATDRGCGLILVTHDRDHAARMGRIVDLVDGVLTERVPA